MEHCIYCKYFNECNFEKCKGWDNPCSDYVEDLEYIRKVLHRWGVDSKGLGAY